MANIAIWNIFGLPELKTNFQETCENQIVPSGVVLILSETPFHPILIQERRFFLLLRSYVPQNLQVRQAYSCKEEIVLTVTGSFSNNQYM